MGASLEDVALMAREALDSTKAAHKRLDTLEGEVRDVHTLATAMGTMGEQVANLKSDVKEIKDDVKAIGRKPARLWEALQTAVVGAVGAGVAATILALILK